MRTVRLAVVAVLLLATVAAGQIRRDPLNDAEIDQLRETAQEPEKRLKLIVQFAQARLAAIEQMRSDPRMAEDRGAQIHDLLEDFVNIVDQMFDYIDDYAGRKLDMRKGLKEVVQAQADFQVRLRTLKETTAKEPEHRDYSFVLQTAIDAVNSGLDEARESLAEQEKLGKKKELRKPPE